MDAYATPVKMSYRRIQEKRPGLPLLLCVSCEGFGLKPVSVQLRALFQRSISAAIVIDALIVFRCFLVVT